MRAREDVKKLFRGTGGPVCLPQKAAELSQFGFAK
jgi:hypothetical protein